MDLSSIKIYRITHLENVPHILTNGITRKDSPKSNPNFIQIGDTSLIDNRSTRQVWVDNGDVSNPIEQIVLGNFIPFYFGVKMPMLFVVQQGGNFVSNANPPEKIVYIACSLQSIIDLGLNFYFSDGHATDNLTTFFNSSKINDLPDIIDWKAVKTAYWGGQDNLNIKRKKQAELLVHEDVPDDCIVGYGSYNDAAKQQLIEYGIPDNFVKVIPKAYF